MTRMLLALLAVCASARADCVKEISSGDVICGQGPCMTTARGLAFCAPSRFGTVQNTLDGVVCARGQLICSAVDGGAVFVDVKGIRCYGQCERASVDLCERSVAAR